MGFDPEDRAYTGCHRRGKPANCAPPTTARFRAHHAPAERPAMNSFELNKILGALLGTCLVLVAMRIAAGAIFTAEKPAKPGYEVAVKEEQPQAGAAPAAPAAVPIETLLASTSAQRGADVSKQCQACHNFQEGQGPKIGPDLYNVVGRKIASVSGFNFSAALKSKNGTWDFLATSAPRCAD